MAAVADATTENDSPAELKAKFTAAKAKVERSLELYDVRARKDAAVAAPLCRGTDVNLIFTIPMLVAVLLQKLGVMYDTNSNFRYIDQTPNIRGKAGGLRCAECWWRARILCHNNRPCCCRVPTGAGTGDSATRPRGTESIRSAGSRLGRCQGESHGSIHDVRWSGW